MSPSDVSVVIPARNEASAIASAIRSASDAGAKEIIVADGDSADATIEVARQAGASLIVSCPPGRGIQLRHGANAAIGRIVLFLHADNRLGGDCLNQICTHPNATWGAFRQHIDSSAGVYRLLEMGNAARVRFRRLPFGDQAIFVDRAVLAEQGGIAEIPLMEDVDLACRLRRLCRPLLLDGPVIVDPRRWQTRGIVRQTLRNWTIQLAYAAGVSPIRLHKWYR
jgi:rSAM/selenodomain-associated transferase 2